jgi:precorrin-2/cobalt-factor-2 C20-methyltransferase
MTASLYIVGTGPGDPELITVKAIKTATACPVIISPRGSENGRSTALSILGRATSLAGKEVLELHFPMKKIHSGRDPDPDVLVAWRHAAQTVLDYLDRGQSVCFPTLGDPAIYSTGYYLYETLCGIRPTTPVIFIPGVAAMSSCSAAMATPICLGDEMVAIVPATFSDERLLEVLQRFDTIVLMKVHRVLERLAVLLDQCGLLEQAVLVERAGTGAETIHGRIDRIVGQPHYYSTIIVRKHPVTARVLVN